MALTKTPVKHAALGCLLSAASLFASTGALVQSQQSIQERIDVRRVVIDVRAIDHAGRAVPGLSQKDFEVKIDGKMAAIDRVEWFPPQNEPLPSGSISVTDAPPAHGRWIVFLYQKHPDLSDVEGFMRLRRDVEGLASVVQPRDHAAVLSFDHSLRCWLDFTSEVSTIRRVIAHELLVGSPPTISQHAFPSLADRLPRSVAAATSSIEDALRLVAQALDPLPGPKTIIMFGYGMGTWLPRFGTVDVSRVQDAIESLLHARVSVFCVDITKAEYHPREEGLRMTADQTGGMYLQSYSTPVLDRLKGMIDSSYELTVIPPDEERGDRQIEVKARRTRTTVIARQHYVTQ